MKAMPQTTVPPPPNPSSFHHAPSPVADADPGQNQADPDADVRSYTRFQVSFFLSGGIFGSAPQPTVQDTWDKIGGPTATGERLREIREELLRLSNAHLPRLPKERGKLERLKDE